MYTRSTSGGYIIFVSPDNSGQEIITEDEFDEIMQIIQGTPKAPKGYVYRLRADTLEWELVELPPMPEPELTDEEALGIILGGAT